MKRFVAFVVAALSLGAAGLAWGQGQGPAMVEVETVVEREIAADQQFVGTVLPVRTAIVGSAVDGRVVEFPVNEGDRVSAGDTLAQLLTETISLELAAAKAELELRTHELQELENGTRPQEIEQARARMQAAKATMDFNQARRKRLQALYQQGRAVSDEDMEQAISAAQAAENAHLEAKAAYELAVAGPRAETILQAKARVDMQDALVRRLDDQIKKHTVISRFDGYVVAEHTEEGQWVNRGEPVAEIAALDEVDIEAHVLEDYVPHVTKGMSVLVNVPAIRNSALPGTVEVIVPKADARSRTFPIKIRVKNTIGPGGPLLKSGMMARVILPVGPKHTALLVPKDAIVLGGPKPLLWVVDPKTVKAAEANGRRVLQGPVKGVPVDLGVADGKWISVKGDIQKGQYLVSKGNERVMPPRPDAPSLVMWPAEASPVARVSQAP